MSTTPPEEPQQPTPPPPSGYTPPAGGYTPPPAYNAPPPAYGAAPQISDSDQRTWAMLAHLSGLLFWFIGPLVIWLIQKEKGRFVEEQSKEALNFQILATIVYIIGFITLPFIIGGIILPVAGLAVLILSIMAAIAANKGEAYRYPLNWRLIK